MKASASLANTAASYDRMMREICFSRSLAIDRRNFLSREGRRENHLQHFDVFAMPDLSVANLWWLMHTGTGLEPHDPLTLVLELNPALEDIHQLKGGLVEMGLAREFLACSCTDDVSYDS